MKQNVSPGMIAAAVVVVVAILALGFYFTQSRLPPPPPIPNMPSGPQSGMVPPGSHGSPSAGASQPQAIPGMGGGGMMPGAPPAPGGGGGMMPGAPPTPGP